LKKRRILLLGAAALAASIAIIPLAATGLFQSVSSSILATKHNPLGIEARVAYVHENTAMSCPMRPCDTSGFVLKLMSKENAKRNLYFSKLLKHDEKGERLNKLRNSLYQYLSLDPHEPDHKGVHFTRDDALFAFGTTSGFCANILKHLEYQLTKTTK